MYRWYENAKICYAYLHDVPGTSFPTARNKERYPDFKGWPEWFSRGWTLQELIAPNNVQFLNEDCKNIGDKRTLAPTLHKITGIPEHILVHGLDGNRSCVAQIMSWAGERKTMRVEDRAYSLMGLLDVNICRCCMEKGRKHFTVCSWKSSAHRTTKAYLRGIKIRCSLAVSLRMTRASSGLVVEWS